MPPPRSEDELIARADVLAARTLGDVADELGMPVPATTLRGKGWTGTVIENALGASAGSLPEPDFRLISVELKTIPIGPKRRPLESTYVCTVPLAGDAAPSWQDSNVRRKLARVLWVPFEGDRTVIALSERRIGSSTPARIASQSSSCIHASRRGHTPPQRPDRIRSTIWCRYSGAQGG